MEQEILEASLPKVADDIHDTEKYLYLAQALEIANISLRFPMLVRGLVYALLGRIQG